MDDKRLYNVVTCIAKKDNINENCWLDAHCLVINRRVLVRSYKKCYDRWRHWLLNGQHFPTEGAIEHARVVIGDQVGLPVGWQVTYFLGQL